MVSYLETRNYPKSFRMLALATIIFSCDITILEQRFLWVKILLLKHKIWDSISILDLKFQKLNTLKVSFENKCLRKTNYILNDNSTYKLLLAEAYLQPYQPFMMKNFAKRVTKYKLSTNLE